MWRMELRKVLDQHFDTPYLEPETMLIEALKELSFQARIEFTEELLKPTTPAQARQVATLYQDALHTTFDLLYRQAGPVLPPPTGDAIEQNETYPLAYER